MTTDRPHILLICCDQLRQDWLGCHGHQQVMTPQIDRLAAAGLDFGRAWAQCPTCVPARRIMLTGRGTAGIAMNVNRGSQPFPQGPKLAELVTAGGYQTWAVGKMHTTPMRYRMGFEEVLYCEEGRRDERGQLDDYMRYLQDRGLAQLAFANGAGNNQYAMRLSTLPSEHTDTQWIADRACDFLQRRDPTRPFFGYVSFGRPHPPITPPPEYWELYRDVAFDPPVVGDWVAERSPTMSEEQALASNSAALRRHPQQVEQIMRGYAALITHIDSMIGMLIGTLNDLGLRRDTHIIFTSDHGEALFDHHQTAKGTPMQCATGVPLILAPAPAWVKENAEPGRLGTGPLTAPAGHIDLLPTICELAGVQAPADIDGRSLVPFLHEARPAFRRWTTSRYGPNFGITDGRWSYQWYADESDVELLFDLDADPRQCRDLSREPSCAGIRDEARHALIAWLQREAPEYVPGGVPTARSFGWVHAAKHLNSNFGNHGRL